MGDHAEFIDEGIDPTGICIGCKFWDAGRIGFFGCPAPCSRENDVRDTFDDDCDWIETMASGLECPIREES